MASVGAVVENWDSIVKTADKMWEMTKKAGRTIGEAASWLADGVKTAGKAIWSHFFGNDVEIDEKTGKVVRQEKSNLLGRIWEGLVGSDEKKLADGQIVKEGGLGLLGNVNNVLMNTVGVFGKMLSGDEWSAGDFVKGTVLEGITTKITDALESFWQGLMGIKDGLVAGFKYVTEFKFVDDIKGAISNWWNGEDETQKKQEGGSEFVGPSDQRSWYQKLGQKMTSWADSNKSKVNSVTVDKNGNKIENRAFGGPLGKNGTMVGELGPELLDKNGNVISGASKGSSMFSDPKLASAGKDREDSVSGMLANSEKNSFYTAQLLQSINASLGGKPVDPLQASNDAVFDPRKGDGAVKEGEKKGLFGTLATAFGIDPETGGKIAEVGSAIGGTISEVGGHAMSGVKGVASSIWGGIKGAASAIKSGVGGAASAAASGDFGGAASSIWGGIKGAASAIKSGVGGATDSVKAATSGVGGAISGGAASVGAAIRGDGKKNLDFLRGFIQQNGITDPKEQAMFLSQLDHESGGFKVLSENLRYKPESLLKVFPKYFRGIEEARQAAAGGPEAIANRVYGNRMGNKQEGDGFKYRGRGFIQLTGRDNYAKAGKDIGIDLLGNPDLASQPETAAKIALWYWKQRGISRPAQSGDIEKVTRLINGGTNGLDDRKSKYTKYLSMVSSPTATAQSGAPTPIKTAMAGGWISKQFPTLVGEREPEVLGPDGRIHRSVDSFLGSPSADVSGLAVNTAIKEAARRAGAGPDHAGAGDAMSKIVAAAGSMGGKSEELLAQMLQALQQIVGNTAKIGDLTAATPSENKSVNVDASNRSAGNIFTLGQSQAPSAPGMSQIMKRVMAGGG
jgi:predicted chitinase